MRHRLTLLVVTVLVAAAVSGCLGGSDSNKPKTSGSPSGSSSPGATSPSSSHPSETKSPPVPAITFSINGSAVPPVNGSVSVGAGVNATLDASGSSDPDGGEVRAAWDLGDGATSTEKTVVHAWAVGNYTVKLTVTDDESVTNSTTLQVMVTALAPPTPPQPAYYFFDDAEANAQKWVFTRQVYACSPVGSPSSSVPGCSVVAQNHPNSQGWHASTLAFHNGTKSWTSQTESVKGYRDDEYTVMTSPKIDLSKASSAVLSFYYKGDAEANGIDGLYWDVSKDGGTTWTPAGKQASSSSNAVKDWTQKTFVIPAAMLTDKFEVRFVFESDSSCSADTSAPAPACGAGAFTAYFVDDILVAPPS